MSVLPMETLDETIDILTRARDDYIRFGTYPTTEEIEPYNRALEYLRNLKPLYLECVFCGQKIAPDEFKTYVFANEAWACKDCMEEGA